jgi:hypothetical protein
LLPSGRLMPPECQSIVYLWYLPSPRRANGSPEQAQPNPTQRIPQYETWTARAHQPGGRFTPSSSSSPTPRPTPNPLHRSTPCTRGPGPPRTLLIRVGAAAVPLKHAHTHVGVRWPSATIRGEQVVVEVGGVVPGNAPGPKPLGEVLGIQGRLRTHRRVCHSTRHSPRKRGATARFNIPLPTIGGEDKGTALAPECSWVGKETCPCSWRGSQCRSRGSLGSSMS